VHDVHVIDPVSRIEGHAKITLRLDGDGAVDDARFHVTEFRGFEDFCRGRLVAEMPALTARTCGICPVSHLIASAKAGDAIMAVAVPPAAERLRRAANLGQIIQSHALSFFHLSAPDLLLGMDADPASRNIFGLMEAEPELVRRGIRLRQFGQEIIEFLGGKKIHPAWSVPGGVRLPRSRACSVPPHVNETWTRGESSPYSARPGGFSSTTRWISSLDRFEVRLETVPVSDGAVMGDMICQASPDFCSSSSSTALSECPRLPHVVKMIFLPSIHSPPRCCWFRSVPPQAAFFLPNHLDYTPPIQPNPPTRIRI
jgi:hypothetical protein